MASTYPYRVSRFRGAQATPMKPWAQRRLELIVLLAKDSMTVNRRYGPNTTHNSQKAKDLRRLIAEGLAELTGKRGWPGRTKYRELELTEQGRRLVPQPPVETTRQPYAKRKAALTPVLVEPESAWD